jgi:hypothetical protein
VNRAETTTIPTSKMTYAEFSLSRPMIDAIDRALAQHYGFTDKELNYDIKYRLGQDGAEESDEE